ncbi:hypothetical protein Tco_1524983 [Tanacetum coccineum]
MSTSVVYLVGTDAESELFEDTVETEAPESPHTIAPPTSLPDSTPPTLVPILRRTTRMVVRVPPAMSPGLFASMAEVAAMSDSAFCKRFRSSYESSPSLSPLDLPLRKPYQGMSELVEDDDEEEDDEEEKDEEEDEDIEREPLRDEGLIAGDEGPGIRVESLSLGGDEVVPEGQQRATLVVETAVAPSIVPLPISSPMIPLTVPSPVASPATAEIEGSLTELGTRVEIQGGLIRDHTVRLEELSPALFERDIIKESRAESRIGFVVTFRAIWRPVLALESWTGQTDAQRATLWHAISDTQMENQDLGLQIAEERRARLDLAEIVDSMRRGT